LLGSPLIKIPFIFFLLLVGAILYWNSLQTPFLWDEHFLILRDPRVYTGSRFFDIFRDPFQSRESGFSTYYRPLITLSFRIDHMFWGFNPLGYHLTNLFFHLSNTFLVYALFRHLFKDLTLSFWGAFLFMAHPAHVEAVTYIPGRVDLIAFFFFLLGFHFYLRGRDLDRKVWSYALSLLFYLLALLSKEMAATLPLVILSHALFVNREERKTLRAEGILIFCSLFLFISWLLLRQCVFVRVPLKDLLDLPYLSKRVLALPGVLLAYFKIWFFPWPLSMERRVPVVALGILPLLGRWILFLVFVVGIFLSLRKPIERFWLFWIAGTLLPVLHIVPIYLARPTSLYIAEHFLYFPSTGIIALLLSRFRRFWVSQEVSAPSLPQGAVLLGGLLTCFSFLVIWRNGEYRDKVTFFEQTIRHAPWSSRAHNQLGIAYVDMGNLEEAEKLFRTSVSLAPNPNPYVNLGLLAGRQGRIEEAIRYHEKGLKLFPGYSIALFNLGHLHANQHEWRKALEYYEEAIRNNPDADTRIYSEKSYVYWELGEKEKALQTVNEGLKRVSSDPTLQGIKKWIEERL